jgi:prophage regulatory protein
VKNLASAKLARSTTAQNLLNQSSILRLPQVVTRVGKCRSGIYADINSGKFPRPIKIGERAVGWLASDIENWLCDRVSERDALAVRQ